MTTGADAAARELRRLGVECAFGVAGTQNVPLLEGLRRRSIRFVPAVSEAGAAFMANGHYRVSGRPGVLVTIGGPGFTMALTGVAEALDDSAGLVWLSCSRQTPAGMRYGLQDLDEAAVAGTLVKDVLTVRNAGAAAGGVGEAFHRALSGEPGPVLVRFQPPALDGEARERPGLPGLLADEGRPDGGDGPPADDEVVGRVAERLRASQRPVFYLGQGAAEAAEDVRTLARRHGAAVLSTTSGRGTVPEDDPGVVHADGPGHDMEAVNGLLDRADLILVLGAKLSQNGSHGFRLRLDRKKLVRVDAGLDALQANYPSEVAIQGPVEAVVAELERRTRTRSDEPGGWPAGDLARWRRRVTAPPDPADANLRIAGGEPRRLPAFVALLRELLPRDAVVVTDSGRHQMVVRRHHRVTAPRGLMVPSDFQSMGFGVPAAVGAKLAAPHRQVLAVVGDGGFAMTGMELMAAAREGVTLPVIVFTDRELGLIRDQQVDRWGRSVGTDAPLPRPRDVARAVGARHHLLEGDLADALAEVLAEPGVTVAELPLARTPWAHGRQARSLARATARRLLGPRALPRLRSTRSPNGTGRLHGRGEGESGSARRIPGEQEAP